MRAMQGKKTMMNSPAACRGGVGMVVMSGCGGRRACRVAILCVCGLNFGIIRHGLVRIVGGINSRSGDSLLFSFYCNDRQAKSPGVCMDVQSR